jgi:hypothetical protein
LEYGVKWPNQLEMVEGVGRTSFWKIVIHILVHLSFAQSTYPTIYGEQIQDVFKGKKSHLLSCRWWCFF